MKLAKLGCVLDAEPPMLSYKCIYVVYCKNILARPRVEFEHFVLDLIECLHRVCNCIA